MTTIKQTFARFYESWNELDMEVIERIRATKQMPRPGEIYKHPQRKKLEAIKAKIDKICGKGSTHILIASLIILLLILVLGGTGVTAAFTIALATCFGGALVISRFPFIRQFILKWFKMIDLLAFIIAFTAANTIFGFQVAAIISLMITVSLIMWNYYAKKDDPKYQLTDEDIKASIRSIIKQLGEKYEQEIDVEPVKKSRKNYLKLAFAKNTSPCPAVC